MPVTAPVTNISRCSLHDGPGIRTVVYFKGCPLSCLWCHNPETQSAARQILYLASKCIHCGNCMSVCPDHHQIANDRIEYLRTGCTSCGRCAAVCPALALNLCGESKTVEEVFGELKKDLHYYKASGGGVTFSGGECLLYPKFLADLAQKCKDQEIHTAVESALYVPWEHIELVLPHTDLFFADLKIPDPEKHRSFTGRDNTLIIENIKKLSHRIPSVILRIPVIPGVNDSREDLLGFASIIRTFGPGVKEIELLKYNHLAESKYRIAGREYTSFGSDSQSDAQMKQLCDFLSQACGRSVYSLGEQ